MSRPANLPPLKSLDEVHRSVKIPTSRSWRRLLAFTGPAYLVSVGYMDPGNWATDLEAGSKFGYRLILVLLMANAMAVLLQTLSARLGLVTGRDLAQACHDDYPPVVNYVLFVLCEIAIAACDLAEVLGTAIGLNLLTGIPLIWAVIITGGDVLLLLAMQHYGIRKMEALILGLISIIGLCFVIEIFLSKPSPPAIAFGLQAVMAFRRGTRGGHRHHRRHGHAAQSLHALVAGAEPRRDPQPRGRGRGLQVQPHRLGHRHEPGVPGERGDPDRRRGDLLQPWPGDHRDPGRPPACSRTSSAQASRRSPLLWR